MNYIIRRAGVSDASYLNGLLTKLIFEEGKYDNNINDKCIVKRLYEHLIENSNNIVLVVEFDGRIIGYLCGMIEYRGDAYKEVVARVDALYVDSDYRNNGIGGSLINEFKDWVKYKNIKYIELCVYDDNYSAIKLYENLGFKKFKSIMNIEL